MACRSRALCQSTMRLWIRSLSVTQCCYKANAQNQGSYVVIVRAQSENMKTIKSSLRKSLGLHSMTYLGQVCLITSIAINQDLLYPCGPVAAVIGMISSSLIIATAYLTRFIGKLEYNPVSGRIRATHLDFSGVRTEEDFPLSSCKFYKDSKTCIVGNGRAMIPLSQMKEWERWEQLCSLTSRKSVSSRFKFDKKTGIFLSATIVMPLSGIIFFLYIYHTIWSEKQQAEFNEKLAHQNVMMDFIDLLNFKLKET